MPICMLLSGQKHYGRIASKSASKGLKKLLPGDEVELSESQAVAFKDKFEILRKTPIELAAEEATMKEAREAALIIVPREDDKFDVRNSVTQEIINDKPLTKFQAEKLASV